MTEEEVMEHVNDILDTIDEDEEDEWVENLISDQHDYEVMQMS